MGGLHNVPQAKKRPRLIGRRWILVTALFFVSLVAALYAMQEYPFYKAYQVLRVSHAQARGEIIRSLPTLAIGAAPTTTYKFTVDEQEYTGVADGSRSVLQAGVDIWYDPADPQINTIADADLNQLYLHAMLVFWLEAGLAILSFVGACIPVVLRLRRFRADMQAN